MDILTTAATTDTAFSPFETFAPQLSKRSRAVRVAAPRKSKPAGRATADRELKVSAARTKLFEAAGSLEKAFLAEIEKAPEQGPEACAVAMQDLVDTMSAICGFSSDLAEEDRALLGQEIGAVLQPKIRLSGVTGRMLTKPRGYAGDYQTIDEMYRNEPYGTEPLGVLVDKALLDAPAARAVRNRRTLLAQIIRETVEARGAQGTRVMSIACGPAREISDAFDALSDPSLLHVDLLDVDQLAIDCATKRVASLGLENQVQLTQGNALRLRSMGHIGEQDLIYSIGLIDYFSDKAVIKLLNQIHRKLAPGGKVVLGNFHVDNVNKSFMDYVLEWQLVHRSEADMHRLFEASDFARNCTQITYETEGINLFAECVKAD